MPKKKPAAKKKTNKRNSANESAEVQTSPRSAGTPVLGQVIYELSAWVFDASEEEVRYHTDGLVKALELNYGIQHFGVGRFGLSEE